jgi:hypothetical protein
VDTILIAAAVRALLHRVGQSACAFRRMHIESERAMGDPARPATDLDDRRATDTRSLSDSRPGPEIHGPLRRRLPQRRDSDHPDAVSGPAGQRRGGAVRANGPLGVSRLAIGSQRRASRGRCSRVHGTLQRPSASSGMGPHFRPSQDVRQCRNGATLGSSAATNLVV